tara:strand:- start:98 stop:646 length:549 start_codon:yes stop_codon:yes gene_type:complete
MAFLSSIARIVDSLNDRIGSVIGWFTLAMVFVGALNALARYATRYVGVSLSSNAYLDLQWYLFSLVFLLGSAYGLNNDHHVRVDIFYSRMSKITRAWINLLGATLLLLPFAALMLWVSWGPISISWRIKEISPDPGGLPRYPIKTVILISFFLLFFQGISQIIKNIQLIRLNRANRSSRDMP